MKTPTKAIGLLVLLVAVVLLALVAARPGEPTYKGTPLSTWVLRYQREENKGPANNEARDALRTIGTNALPFLSKWSNYDPPTWPLKLAGHIPGRFIYTIYRLIGSVPKAMRSDAATYAFSAFPANADVVVPQLTQLMTYRPVAIEALARLGTPGLPPLLTAWSNSTNLAQRWQIQDAVTLNLAPDVRTKNVLPLLLATYNQGSQSLRTAASNAIFQIEPELIINTPAN